MTFAETVDVFYFAPSFPVLTSKQFLPRTPEVQGELVEVEIPKSTHGAAILGIAQACDAWPENEVNLGPSGCSKWPSTSRNVFLLGSDRGFGVPLSSFYFQRSTSRAYCHMFIVCDLCLA